MESFSLTEFNNLPMHDCHYQAQNPLDRKWGETRMHLFKVFYILQVHSLLFSQPHTLTKQAKLLTSAL